MGKAWTWLIVAVLLGCGSTDSKDDSKVVGDWVGKFVMEKGMAQPGANLTLDKGHHWRELYRNLDVQGTWILTGLTLTLNTETFGGKPVAEAKQLMLQNASKTPNPKAYESMAANLDKPITLILSADGRTLSRDDPQANGKAVYTKQ